MTADIAAIWAALFGGAPERVPTLLVGHSMGGALAVRAAAGKGIQGLDGVVVVDVVEGTALGECVRYAAGAPVCRPPASFPSGLGGAAPD